MRLKHKTSQMIAVVGVLILACSPSSPPPPQSPAGPPKQSATTTSTTPHPASDRSPEPLNVGGDVVAPVVISRVPPDWSKLPKNFHYTGIVLIEAVIDDGIPIKVRALKGQPELADPTVAAIRQWRFKPGTLLSKPVPVISNLTANPHFR